MKILLVCSGGMSTTILANALEKIGKADDPSFEIKAVGVEALANEVGENHHDVLLVAPQVKFKFATLSKIADEANLPALQIAPQEYIPPGAPALYERVKDFLKGV